MAKILAASFHPGGTNAIIPVVEKLREQHEVVVIGYDTAVPILRQRGIPHMTIEDYGLKLLNPVTVWAMYTQELPDLVLTGTSMQSANNKPTLEQQLTVQAKVPTIAVLDFWAQYWERFSDLSGKRFGYLPTKIAVMDDLAKEEMLTAGIPNNNIVVTGNPHFEYVQSLRVLPPEGNRVLLYATSLFKEHKAEYGFWDLDNLKILGEEMPKGIQLRVKIHPRTVDVDKKELAEYVREIGGTVEDAPIIDLINSSNIVMTSVSTVALEAFILGRQVASLQPGLKCKNHLHFMTGKLPIALTEQVCRETIQTMLSGEYESAGTPSDYWTGSTDRVVSLINELIKTN